MAAWTEDNRGNINASAKGEEGVKAQTAVLIAHIQARVVIKLGLYVLAGIFVIVASLLVVFAPSGRETATEIIAAALFALAAGAAGFSTFAIKTPLVSAEAGHGNGGTSPTPDPSNWPPQAAA
jgi:hypothetical protein